MSAQREQVLPAQSAAAGAIGLLAAAAPAVPTPRLQRKAAWLALYFPGWPLTVVFSGMTSQQRARLQVRPFAVIDHDRKRCVLSCNELAHRRGLRPGHSLNAAIALCSDLEVASRDVVREMELLESTARECQRYTPTVCLEPPNQLLLEVRGSLRLFGGARALVDAVCADFAKRGLTVAAALTPTVRSALWLSRAARCMQIVYPRSLASTLLPLSIELLQWPSQVTLRLARFGVRTLADLRRLPRDGLARRIGVRYLNELDAAFGRRPEPRRALAELPQYRDRVVLDAELETTGLLEPQIAARVLVLERFLISRTLALSELVLALVHRAHPPTLVRIALALPTLDMKHLQTLLREHLAALQLPAPIVELQLHATHLVPADCRSRPLFQAGGAPCEDLAQRLARLVETLESRLGKQRLRALRAIADHRPEHAQSQGAVMLDAAVRAPVRSELSGELPDGLPQRPLWLLREPAPLRACEFAIAGGAELIESGWWDGRLYRREYFVACRQGALCWVFRDLAAADEQWYLHGLFG